MTARLHLLLFATCLAAPLHAHDLATSNASNAELLPQLSALRDASMASDYAYRQTAMLADEIGPRLSGSLGAAVAVERVAEALRALGLVVTLEPVKVPHWVRGEESAALVDWPQHRTGLSHAL
jgi:hypothetical protein